LEKRLLSDLGEIPGMCLEHPIPPESREAMKFFQGPIVKGPRNQLEEAPTGQRGDILSIIKDNTAVDRNTSHRIKYLSL